jgi:hypothetical protein
VQNQVEFRQDGDRKKSLGYAHAIGERRWTAVEKHKLRGLVARQLAAAQIARHLRRPLASIKIMASSLGIHIDKG